MNRNRRDLNINIQALSFIDISNVQRTRLENVTDIFESAYDFHIGDELEVNMARDFAPDFYRGNVVTIKGDIIRLVEDMSDPYAHKTFNRYVLRPVVTA